MTDRPEDAATETLAQALAEMPCACGHRWSTHDPEDGRCDSLGTIQQGQCPCPCFRQTDPGLTRFEAIAQVLLREKETSERRDAFVRAVGLLRRLTSPSLWSIRKQYVPHVVDEARDVLGEPVFREV